ncbi:MAG: ankyrin repeat domain-containing protein [bacterium]
MKKLCFMILIVTTLFFGCEDKKENTLLEKMKKTAERNKEIKKKLEEEKEVAKKPTMEEIAEQPLPPIVKAAAEGDLAQVKNLIKESGSKNKRDHRNRTPLYMASENGRFDVVKYLVEKNASISSSREDGDTPIMAAARNGHEDIVKFLVENDADVNATNNFGRTVLMAAAQGGDKDIISFLLSKKAELNARDKYGKSALIFAMEYDHMEIAKWLLDKGAEVWKEKPKKARKPLTLKIDGEPVKKNEHILEEIEKEKFEFRPKTELFYAVEAGDLDLVKRLVAKGSPVTVTDIEREREIIIYPQSNGEDENHEKLFERAVERTAYDRDRKNLLMYAAEKAYLDIIKFLVKKGARLEETDGETVRGPLFYVATAEKGDEEFEKRLAETAAWIIEKGKETWKKKEALSQEEIDKRRAEHKNAAWYDRNWQKLRHKIVEQPKVNIEDQDWEGWTVLTLAAKNGHYHLVKTLIEKGVMINRKERKFGRTALIYSRVNEFPRIEKLLKKHGAMEGIDFDAEELEKQKQKQKKSEK